MLEGIIITFGKLFDLIGRWRVDAGADYGLGTIGTCLGPPPARGPPSDQKNKNPMITVKETVLKMTRMGVS